jgi:glycosyltransferase involved in cell wall biosynthesis
MSRLQVASPPAAQGAAEVPAAAANPLRIAVVIPSYRVVGHILEVIARIGPEVERIYVVDDACPDRSGDFVAKGCSDPRVQVLRHERNRGVGGAVKTGYQRALAEGMDVAVKIDGDGQMAPELLPLFVRPIRQGLADYVKGNRFYNIEDVRSMPPARLFGNAVLSFLTKLSTGYWRLFDPTNGYTAIHRTALGMLPLDKVADGYFFESDLLFRLATIRGVVLDVPMRAVYGDEKSGLRIARILFRFLRGHAANFVKRIFYNYFLRDFSLASLELVAGCGLLSFSAVFGIWKWVSSSDAGVATPAGTVMLAALPAILGLQLLLSFLGADLGHEPTRVLQSMQE